MEEEEEEEEECYLVVPVPGEAAHQLVGAGHSSQQGRHLPGEVR